SRPPTKRSARQRELKSASPRRDRKVGKQLTTAHRVAAVRVVGIGASAGGLDAFIDLLSAIPGDTGLAFVLIQHLDPRHESMLVDILAGAIAIPVQEVVDGMPIEPDHVY